MVKVIVLLWLPFIIQKAGAQLLPERIVSSSGGQLVGSNVYIDYSIGELAVATVSTASNHLNQGFLQLHAKKTLKIGEPTTVSFSDSTLKVFELVTPNGDGKNELFYVNGIHKYPENELMIVNKWGDIVYKTTRYANTWDGGDLPDGSYFYVLKLLSNNQMLSGGFTLAR